MKLAAILLGTVVLVLVSASLALPGNETNEEQEVTTNVPDLNSTCIDCEPLDFAQSNDTYDSDDESEEEVDGETEIDGIKLKNLSPTEFYALIIDDDNIVRSELDIIVGREIVKEREEVGNKGLSVKRPKRWIVPVGRAVFSAGRALFRSSSFRKITKSGGRITKHYNKGGNYNKALKDYKSLKPTNSKPLGGSKYSGYQGNVGKHNVIVRNGSKGPNSRPTLEIQSPKPGGKTYRKFRYNGN